MSFVCAVCYPEYKKLHPLPDVYTEGVHEMKLQLIDVKVMALAITGFIGNLILFFDYPQTQPYCILILGVPIWGLLWLMKSKKSFLNIITERSRSD